ncbi:hypothetical protein LUZ60_016081 [Juncus effusus]|nr:hypothetical protein LUZ60_016081 [Juncus effusus]
MIRTGQKENQNNDKVYPQPLDETAMNQNQNNNRDISMDALISKIFTNISSLKSAYIQLQDAHTPYDPDRIQEADKLVIEELTKLSELKHTYRDRNPKSVSATPQDSRLLSEIQQQQNLLKTYEVMVKKFQTQIQNRDGEITQLQSQIEEAKNRKSKLEKKLKQRGLSSKDGDISEEEEENFFSIELTPNLFTNTVESAFKSIHDFSKPLINMMKAAGWDLDAATDAIVGPGVIYAKRSHKKYAFESYICQRMFAGFQEESFSVKTHENGYENGNNNENNNNYISNEGFFHQYLAVRAMDPLDVLSQNPDSNFGKFCKGKYLILIHPKMEVSFFGNMDQRNYVTSGGHPRTPFYQAFLRMAKSIWLLHRLANSFEPKIRVFQVKQGSEFSEVYMESVVKNVEILGERPKVGLMVMPGFMIGTSVVQSQVYLNGVKCTD